MARKQIKIKTNDFPIKTGLFWSGFCLTDNKHFALFNIGESKIKEFGLKKVDENFILSAENLNMFFNKEPISVNKKIFSTEIYAWFKKQYPKMAIHQVTTFFDKNVSNIYVVLKQPGGVVVGLLKSKEGKNG